MLNVLIVVSNCRNLCPPKTDCDQLADHMPFNHKLSETLIAQR